MTAPAKTRNRRGTGANRQRAQSAPAVESAPGTTPPTTAPRSGGRTGRTTAAERAYARRAQRAELLQREPGAVPAKQKTKTRLRWPTSRASFVLMMMGLLAAGVAATLWLSTQAIADSYRLEQLRGINAKQAEQAEQLQRQVTTDESASALAQKAKELGMVPGGDPARIVVNPDGSTTVVGVPKKAQGANTAPPVRAPVAPVDGTQPVQGAPVEGDQPAVPVEPDTAGH
jgi:type II secretory pathway pseudopilin PulG